MQYEIIFKTIYFRFASCDFTEKGLSIGRLVARNFEQTNKQVDAQK